MSGSHIVAVGFLLAFTLVPSAGSSTQPPLATVPSVDLNRYVGRWYEIARYPNRFENKCDRDVTATYALRPDGKISVANACTNSKGKLTNARGWARIVEGSSNTKLKVTFFWPFFGDYWIIDLHPDYQFAVIGEPSRKYLWILSRTPRIDDATYAQILARIQKNGYDISRIERTRQTQ